MWNFVQLSGQGVDAFLTLLWNGTGEMERDEVATLSDFPVGKPPSPEGHWLRLADDAPDPSFR